MDLNISALMVVNQSCILEDTRGCPSHSGEWPEITYYLVLHRWERDSSPGLGFPTQRAMKEVLGPPELVPSTPGALILSLSRATQIVLLSSGSLSQIFKLSEGHQQSTRGPWSQLHSSKAWK